MYGIVNPVGPGDDLSAVLNKRLVPGTCFDLSFWREPMKDKPTKLTKGR